MKIRIYMEWEVRPLTEQEMLNRDGKPAWAIFKVGDEGRIIQTADSADEAIERIRQVMQGRLEQLA